MSLAEAPAESRREIVFEAVRRLLRRLPEMRQFLERMLAVEASCERLSREERLRSGFSEACCWPWWLPRLTPRWLQVLLEYEIVAPCGRLRPGDRRSPMTYRLVDRGAVAEALGVRVEAGEAGRPRIVQEGCTFPVSEEALEQVIGYDRVKKWIRRALCSRHPTHVLLYGAPGTAKTELARLVYEDLKRKGYPVKMIYVSSAGTTGAGLLEALINLPEAPTPSLLIIDEIDKVRDRKVLDILAHAMEHQMFTVNKHGVDETYERKVWVIATANDITRLPPHLLDRFGPLKFYFPPYSKEQFINIVPRMLTQQYEIDEELARYIAEKLAEAGILSVREARDMAKVVQSKEDVDDLIEHIKKRRQYWQWRKTSWR